MLLPFIYLFMFPCLIKTYSIKNPFWRWTAIIYPPLGLLTLIWVPVDIASVFVWGPAAFAVYVSVTTSVINTIHIVYRILKKRNSSDLPIRFIRPFLTALCFFISLFTVETSLALADKYAVDTAREIQSSAETKLTCPQQIKGWQTPPSTKYDHNVTSEYYHKKYGTRHLIKYIASDDLQSFAIEVRHHIDLTLVLSGGVDRPLKAYHYFDGGKVGLDIESCEDDVCPIFNPWMIAITVLSAAATLAAMFYSKQFGTTVEKEIS